MNVPATAQPKVHAKVIEAMVIAVRRLNLALVPSGAFYRTETRHACRGLRPYLLSNPVRLTSPGCVLSDGVVDPVQGSVFPNRV
jgi:hypothetical protein